MPNTINQHRISDNIIRIILLRVLPGSAEYVAHELQTRAEEAGIDPKQFRIFRMFGGEDIVYLQEQCTLETSPMVEFGTIRGISGSSEYICFYAHSQPAGRLIETIDGPLLSFSFVKLNPRLTQKLGLIPELHFSKYVAENQPNIKVLGTLGWAELILLISESSLEKILECIGEDIPNLILNYQSDQSKKEEISEFLAEKTLSMIGYTPKIGELQDGIPIPKGDEPGAHNLKISFSIVCRPHAMFELHKKAITSLPINGNDQVHNLSKSTSLQISLGSSDLEYQLDLEEIGTLRDLVMQLDRFRQENAKDILMTNTCIHFDARGWPRQSDPEPFKVVMFEVSPETATRLATGGPELAALASGIYHYNNLIHSGFLLDAYDDLARNLQSLVDTYGGFEELSTEERKSLSTELQHLQHGIAQRSDGTFLGLSGDPRGGSFSMQASGMGIHRILKALAVYASAFLRSVGRTWNGFVLVGYHMAPRMEHYHDKVFLPPHEAMLLKYHFALTHEIMHVMQYDDGNIDEALGFGRPRTPLEKILVECLTEIMDYSLACPLGIKGYLRAVWTYMSEVLSEGGGKLPQVASYLMRSFAVEKYHELCYSPELFAENSSYIKTKEAFRRHVKMIRKWVDLGDVLDGMDRGLDRVDHIAMNFHESVLPSLERIQKYIENRFAIRGKREFDRALLLRIKRDLQDGRLISPVDMRYPEAVPWMFVEKGLHKIGDRVAVAWMLSLWHYYQVRKFSFGGGA